MRVGHLWRLLAVVIMVLSSIGRADLAAAGDPGLPPPPAPSKSGAPKLDGTLIAITRAYETGGMAAATQEAGSRNVGMPAPGQVRVVVEAAAKGQDAAAAAIKAAGGVVAARYQGLLAASVPVASMKLLTGEASVSFIRLPAPHHADVTSEGLARVDAARWHTAGQRGQGVKVAIVDLGFKGYETKLGGELPGSVITRCFCSDGVGIGGFGADGSGEVHGTAVAEIVHDMAPDAQLYLVRIGNEVDLGNAVDYLISQGVRVANHSVGWFQTGGGDGTGTVADIIGRARDAGILWVNSGGNYAQRYWEGPWSDGNSNNWLDFASADETDDFTLGPNGCITAYLSWNNWPVTNQDYDLYLFGAGNLSVPLAASVGDQTGSQSPTETLDFCSTTGGSYTLAIRRFSASPPTKFRLFTLGVTPQYRTTSGSLASPADSPKAFAVGAMAYNAETLESFSSQGPTQDGRIKPDITGPDGVSTATYGTGGFFGTSAAAPHVAGAAALVAGRFPARTAANLQANLTGAAQDYGSQGGDNLYGAGMLRMPDDMIVAGPPIRLAFTISPQNTLAGVPLSKQPAVVVQDANGFVVTTATNPITVTLTSGASIAGGSVSCPVNPVTPSDGTAVFSGCVVEAEGVGITLTASSPGLASAVSEPFRVTPPSGLINPTVTLSDAAPGRTGVTVTTTFTISTAIKADTDVVVIFPTGFGIASARAVNTPNSGTMVGLTGVNVSEPLKDSQGLRARRLPQLGALPVAAGVRVRLNIENVTNPSGSGLAGPFVICTREGSFGDAIACMTSIAGDESILDSGVAWDVVISPAAGVPAKLALSLPNGAVPSVLWERQPLVTVLDGADKPVSGATNPITLTISGGPTGAALQCAANPANAQAGSALFSACAINTAGTYTLTASSGSLLAAVQSGFLVSPTAAVKLGAVSTSFGPAAAPTTFTVKATAQTTAGAAFPVGTATNVRLVLKTGSGTLGGTLTAAMPPGASTVTFPAVTYSVAESGVLLTVEAFAGATLVPADSEPFTVTAQPQVLLRFDPNPVAVGLGAGSADVRIVLETGAQPVDGVQVTVSFDPAKLRVEDADPNADGVQLIPGAALSQMLLSNVDNVAGMVRFAASRTVGQPAPSGSITVATIKLSGRAAGTWPLTFTPGGSEVGSETLNLGVGLLNGAVQVTPRRLAFVAQPVRGAGGVAFGFQPVVAVQDAAGQTIVTDNATVVTLALAADGGPAGAQLQCAQMTRQAAAGVAMFEGCSINLPGGGYMLEATADGMDAGRAAPLSITLPGDVDGDCRVNVMDFSTVVSSYGQSPGAVGWPATEGGAYRADINGDGRVGVVDFSTLVNKYGGSVAQCAPPSDLPTVAITGAAFRTPALTVSVGSTIVWLNRDIAAHTITGDTGGWASRSLAPGASFSRRFDTPGTYAYHSAQNPAMQGTITVQ